MASAATRILRVITRLNIGGPTRHVAILMKGLDPAAFEQVLVHGTKGPEDGEGFLPVPGSSVHLPELQRGVRAGRDLRALRRLRALIREQRPAIVHTHQGKAGALGRLAARLEGVPHVVHTFHGHTFRGYFGPLGSRAVRAVERRAARWTERLVCQSASQERDVLAFLGGVARGRTYVVLPGIEVERFERAPAPRAGRERVLLLPARLVRIKRPERAVAVLDAVRRHWPAVLWIAGEGPEAHAVREAAAARSLAGEVRLLGPVAAMERLYPQVDLVLLTSAEEGTPLVLLEAMAAGVPVAAPAVGGVADTVGDAGLLLDADATPAAWGDAIAGLLAEVPRVEELVARGRRRVRERFSAERLCRDVAELYGGLLRGGSGPRSR